MSLAWRHKASPVRKGPVVKAVKVTAPTASMVERRSPSRVVIRFMVGWLGKRATVGQGAGESMGK